MTILDDIQTELREHRAQRQGAREVFLENVDIRYAYAAHDGLSFRLDFTDHSYQFERYDPSERRLLSILQPLLPTILIQLYRLEHYEHFRQWQSYVPPGGRRYAVVEPLRMRSIWSDDLVNPEFHTTYDPFHARDPDGEQLLDDMRRLSFHILEITDGRIPIGALEAHVDAIRGLESFRGHPGQQNRQHVSPMHVYETYEDAYRRASSTLRRNDMADALSYAYSHATETAQTRDKAERRGWALLREHLTQAQLTMLDKAGYFEVTGNKTGTLYRINTGRAFNVDIMRDGAVEDTICFQPRGGFVTGDVMLTQKLMLELREDEALAVANRRGGRDALDIGAIAQNIRNVFAEQRAAHEAIRARTATEVRARQEEAVRHSLFRRWFT